MTMNTMLDLEKALEAALLSAHVAGAVILQNRASFGVGYKGEEREIVTTADLRANEVIKDILCSHFPEAGWLSEETEDNQERLQKELVWCVDPLDGTTYFAKGEDKFTVSIALIRQGSPILGVIYRPTTKEVFYATQGKGAYLNGKPIRVSSRSSQEAILITSIKVKSKPGFRERREKIHCGEMLEGGTALRLARLAQGDADIYLSMGNTEWGIAAGDIIVREAGGTCTDLQGGPLTYNKKRPELGPMLMSNGGLHDRVLHLINT